MVTMNSTYIPGLKGVIAAETRLSTIDGERGELIIGGFALDEIAGRATFEEMLFLLWEDRLPTKPELEAFTTELASYRILSDVTSDVIRERVEAGEPIMAVLRAAIGTLPVTDEPLIDARQAVAAAPVIVAAAGRLLQGQDVIAPRDDLNHAANYLWMLTCVVPSDAKVRALQTYLCTVIDHGLNASTFTARVIASTGSDVISAVVGGVGALKGPLHGGAPGPALDMVLEIGEAERAEPYLREQFEQGALIMGFGHRVYRVRDPRADVLAAEAERLFAADGDRDLYDLARHVEDITLRLFEEYKPGRRIQTNVEFYTALILNGLDLPTDLFAPTFAISRVGGWTAHIFEQIEAGKIIRPASAYVGDTGRQWVPIDQRG